MLIQDSTNFGISTYVLSKISAEEWIDIEKYKFRYKLIAKSPNIGNLLYPGFCFSDDKSANFYYDHIYNRFENVFTPPRGNLTKENRWIVVGIKPGSYFAHYSKAESSWLLGPSSEMLHKFLYELGIYPYFTNVYKAHTDEENKDINGIYDEIVGICKLYSSYYNIDSCNLNILCLGNYDEYNDLFNRLANNFYSKSPKFYKVWHPAYILRKNTQEMFTQWLNQFKRQTNEIGNNRI